MAFQRMKDLEDIMKGLSLLQYYVRFSSNKLGLHSINKLCEPFFAELFNRMYGFKLKTIEKKNYPAIDLKDKKNRYAVQITSNGSKAKLDRTVRAFEDNKMHDDYDTLLHFIIGEKRFNPPAKNPYPFKRGEHDGYFADVEEKNYQIIVQDINDLILAIDALDDDELSAARNYINGAINVYIDLIKKTAIQFCPGSGISVQCRILLSIL
ncbi:SMEK domain-containing protein [Paenibacillus rhizoplanae]|uniref:SMEK domain-containing protein n=1 Tax=Paenibacillus rhizoplanae TaxID=1917181 RepID=UPI0036199694